MPCDTDIRRAGGASGADTDAAQLQYDATGNLIVGAFAENAPNGVPGYIDFVAAPDGTRACRFTCPPSAPASSSGSRAEVSFPLFAIPTAPAQLQSVFRMKVWLGSEWMTGDRVSIAQLHRGEALPDRWLFMLLYAGKGVMNLTIPLDFASDEYLTVCQTPIIPNSWMDISIRQSFVKAATGEAEMFVNGARVGAVRGVRTSYDDTTTGPYPKVGIYNILRYTTGPYVMYLRDYEQRTGPDPDSALGIVRRNRRGGLPMGR